MTIKNFEASLPVKTVTSGREYFSKEKIMELVETKDGRWTAAVWSNKYLELSVDLKGDTITSATCACGPFNKDGHCTHTVAMLYAIRYAKGMIPEREAFINSDPGALGGQWASEADKNSMAKYARLIRDPFNQARDITGHIYRDQANKVMRIPSRLLDEAKKNVENGNHGEAVNIILAVIETTSYCAKMLEHGDSSMHDIYYIGFELLGEILSQSPSNELKRRLYEHGVSGGIEIKDSIDYYHTFWFEFLIQQKLCYKQDNRLPKLIDTLVSRAKQNRNPHVEKELLNLKELHAKNLGAEPDTIQESAVMTTRSNITAASAGTSLAAQAQNVPTINQQKETGTIPDSPVLVSALEKARKEGNKKRIEMYQQCILSERSSRNDNLGVREIALELFKDNPTKTYLNLIRETYTEAQWEKEGKKYMQQLKSKAK